MGGYRRYGRRSRRQALAAAAAGAAAVSLALSLTACGGEASSDSNEAAGNYPVKVVTAAFPAKQRLGETTLLRLGVRNTGAKALPALTVTISVGGKEGRSSTLPFGYRDPEVGLAQPDRPIWALSSGYPKANGSSERAGAETANPKTFDFGPLKPGATTEAVWKLSAVKAGRYALFYEIGAGLGGTQKAEVPAAGDTGTEAGGSFVTQITDVPPETEVTDNGEVVEIEGKMDKRK
ncbi:MAG TPA: hypothetical protein VLK56_07945 [Solirubrobacterales bacterium]|nr:hypothetical protein [Solirubrobacterales bacterium]